MVSNKTKRVSRPRLKSLRIQNFKGIKFLEIDNLPKSAPWIFLTGENGYGKTCVLQALASALAGPEEHIFQYSKNSNSYILKATLFGKENTFAINHPANTVTGPMVYLQNIACYGSARLDTYTESSSRQQGITSSLYDTRALLENIELQLTRWVLKKDDPEFKTKYESVTTILKKLLHVAEITVDTKHDLVLYHDSDKQGNAYNPLPSTQIAAGYRSIISMIGDMILRLFETQPINEPSKLSGIVIIDELDLHFHPKWQKQLPTLLSETFPNIQFIASTHSPIPLLGAPKDSVFLKVNRNLKEGITLERLEEIEMQIGDLLPNTILSSPVFGMQDIFPVSHQKGKRVRTEDTWDELLINDKLKERLQQFKGTKLEDELVSYVKEKRRGYDKK